MRTAKEIAELCRTNRGFRDGYYCWIWVKASLYGHTVEVNSGCQSWRQLRRYRRALRRRDAALARGPARPSVRELRAHFEAVRIRAERLEATLALWERSAAPWPAIADVVRRRGVR